MCPRSKGSPPKSLVLPTTVCLSIPLPVLVGGPPTISLMALGMRLGMPLLKALGKKLGAAFKKLRQKVFKNMDPGFLKCKILRAERVNQLTGQVHVE